MSSKNALKFFFIKLDEIKPVEKDSLFSILVKALRVKFDTDISGCVDKNRITDNCCESENTIIIAFARMEDLHNPKTSQRLSSRNIRPIYEVKSDENNVNPFNYHPCPMIVVGLEELPGVLEEKVRQVPDEKSDSVLENQLQVVRALNLDAKVNFFDSSIWHYYVPLNENFEDNFRKTLQKIKDNFESNLYKTNVAKEFLEFQTRLLKNSYLAQLSGTHATKVTPFQFHSATEMSLKAERIKESFKDKNGGISFKWRLLLVDDYADKNLLIDGEGNGGEQGEKKREILEKVILGENGKDPNWIEIETCSSVNEFIDKYSKNKKNQIINDIILLDYLLGNVSVGKSHGNGREYATDLLKWIKGNFAPAKEKRVNENLQGPLGKFWFFPISVFSYAFMEELHQLGYKHLEEEWHIARGADPVNTPELFRYSLFKFMEMQINEARSFGTILDLIEKVFPYKEIRDSTDNPKIIQSLAKKNYHIFLREMNSFEMLVYDKKNKSRFAKSFLDKYKDIDNSLWGHLHHLIFMLGNESASEWAKMWDELNIIEDRLIQIGALSEHDGAYLMPIKNYIINLQKQVR